MGVGVRVGVLVPVGLAVGVTVADFMVAGGVLLFGDKVSGIQACFMALTVVGIVGTKVFAQA